MTISEPFQFKEKVLKEKNRYKNVDPVSETVPKRERWVQKLLPRKPHSFASVLFQRNNSGRELEANCELFVSKGNYRAKTLRSDSALLA